MWRWTNSREEKQRQDFTPRLVEEVKIGYLREVYQ